MLEERLSKAYSQQNLGYNLPGARQPSGGFAPMQANGPGASAGAELFYGAQPPTSYHAALDHGYPPHQQASQPSYMAGQGASAQPYPQQQMQSPPPPPQAALSPSAESHASYYFNPSQPGQMPPASGPSAPGPAPDATQSPYPTLQQPPQHRGSISSPPQATPTQHPSQPVQQYWQQNQGPQAPQAQQQPTQPQQQNWGSYASYSQPSFPSAPQHEPVSSKPIQEEALIDL